MSSTWTTSVNNMNTVRVDDGGCGKFILHSSCVSKQIIFRIQLGAMASSIITQQALNDVCGCVHIFSICYMKGGDYIHICSGTHLRLYTIYMPQLIA